MLLEKTMPAAFSRTMSEAATLGPVHLELTNLNYARGPAGRRFAQPVMAAWSRCLAWWMRRQTRLALRSLDERTLADIGLKRSEIDAALGGRAR
jgi:uncharacterized protein YjiS (DUF1127 family)